jgi:hypothetical protein
MKNYFEIIYFMLHKINIKGQPKFVTRLYSNTIFCVLANINLMSMWFILDKFKILKFYTPNRFEILISMLITYSIIYLLFETGNKIEMNKKKYEELEKKHKKKTIFYFLSYIIFTVLFFISSAIIKNC